MKSTQGKHRNWPKIVFVFGGVAVAIVSGCIVALVAFLEFGMCSNHVVAAISSPDGSHTATVFQRDCGATTDFSTQITVDPIIIRRPLGTGNLWIADADHGAAPRAPWGGPEVRVEWMSNSDLKVVHHPAARVFRAAASVSGVSITYESAPSVAPNKPLQPTRRIAPRG